MPTFTIELTKPIMVHGEYYDKGLSVQVSTFFNNPWNESTKINKAFKRIHGVDLKQNNFLNQGYLKYS